MKTIESGLFVALAATLAVAPLHAQRVEHGQLGPGDAVLEDGEYFDVYRFQGQAGQTITVTMQSGEFDTYLMLRSPSNSGPDNDDYEGSTSVSRITHTLEQSGEWRVLATSYAGGETGSYEVRIEFGGSGGTVGRSRTESGALGAGDPTLEDGEYYDTYRFQGRAGQQVRLRLTSGQFDTYLMLRSPSNSGPDNDDYNGSTSESQIVHTLDSSGEWRVLVTSYAGGETGSYQLVIEFLN